jgi:hypothetical protein
VLRRELDKDDGDIESGPNRMTTPRAALHVATEYDGGSSGKLSDLARDRDPLRRLEAELQSADPEQADVERLYEKTWTLLEEAWGLMTECLVMRDGLLDACREIEQTMDAVHGRLQALSPPTLSIPQEPSASETRVTSAPNSVNDPNSAVAP